MVSLFSATLLRLNQTIHKNWFFSHINSVMPRALCFALQSVPYVKMYANLCIDLLLDIAWFDILFLYLLPKFRFIKIFLWTYSLSHIELLLSDNNRWTRADNIWLENLLWIISMTFFLLVKWFFLCTIKIIPWIVSNKC